MARTLAILAVVVVAFAAVAMAQTAPVWPAQYKFTGNFQLPYFNISEPLTVITDATNHRQVISWYNDMDYNLYRFDTKMSYALSPADDKMVCQTVPGHGTITAVLPPLQGWLFSGYEVANDVYCSKWVLVQTHYNKTATYNAYVDDATGAPVRLELFGYDFIFGSHPDIYVLNVDTWLPNYNNASAFAVPALCQTEDARTHDYGLREQLMAARERMGRLGSAGVEQVSDDTMFRHFASKFGKSYADAAELAHRRNVFKKNAAFIRSYNDDESPVSGITLAMNHLADLEEAEIRARLMPHLPRPADNGARAYYTPRSAPGTLPASVDWRLKGAVAPVKDQATCGSCWTFGSAGALEGVAAVATGNLVELSEQQIVDCCWGEDGGSQGCGGGFAADAFSWIMQNGGIATEQDYPYLGQNAWCQANAAASGIQVSGYVNVTSGSEADLADAVANAGPVAVAIDATAPTFYFYSEGIFYWSKCKSDLNSLDHEVLVVGYGTSPQGQDYWIVKNSWSVYWGLDGFVLMARNRNNNCGIASQATQPEVSA